MMRAVTSWILTILLVFCLNSNAAEGFTGYSSSMGVLPFNTKVAYMDSFTDAELQLLTNPDSYVPNTCTPLHVGGVVRHGSRFPSSGDILAEIALAEKIHGKVTNESHAELNDTFVQFKPEDDKNLAEVGKKELQDIGKRMGNRYLTLMNDITKEELIYISSKAKRAIESGENFQKGFGEALYDCTEMLYEF